METKIDCRRMGAWGDICVYHDVCYDATTFYFLRDSVRDDCRANHTQCGHFYGEADLKTGRVYPLRQPPDINRAVFPFNGGEGCTIFPA